MFKAFDCSAMTPTFLEELLLEARLLDGEGKTWREGRATKL